MVSQLFGDGFGELRTEMPEKRMTPGPEQAHEAVADEDEAEKLQESLLHKVRSKKAEGRSKKLFNYRLTI